MFTRCRFAVHALLVVLAGLLCHGGVDAREGSVRAAAATTTYWLWNPTTNLLVRELVNNTASCIAVPYNIEVRPATPPSTLPVQIQLKNATFSVIKGQGEDYAPYYLWGDNPTTKDVFPSKKPLPPGTYWLYSTINGKVEKVQFTQTC